MQAEHQPGGDFRSVLECRAALLSAIRGFFEERGFLEVETPVRLPAPAPEVHIEAEPSGRFYLRTSPELHMKRLLTLGHERIFQVGPCFRKGERGDRHHPEYTMLEWYRIGADYIDILADTKALLIHLAKRVHGSTELTYQGNLLCLEPLWEVFTVSELFLQHASWDPVEAFDADRFSLDLISKVEPALPSDHPVVVKDYPVEMAALARLKESRPTVAERWELYMGGIELANAYSELTDAAKQRTRFESWNAQRRKEDRETYAMDEAFLVALEQEGLPACGGIALGIDRLVMLFADCPTLDQVLPFRE